MSIRPKTVALLVGYAMLPACAGNGASVDTDVSDHGDVETADEPTLEELLSRMDAGYEAVRPMLECIDASGKVELRTGDEYSDEEITRGLPVLNGLSEKGRLCARAYEDNYAGKVLAACAVANCGHSHPDGCIAVLPFTRNMAVMFDAAYACVDED